MSLDHLRLGTSSGRRRPALAILVAGLMLALAAPVHAVAVIVEDEVFSSPGREVIHVRVQQPPVAPGACQGLPTDRVEVEIPVGVYAVLAESVPGWTIETETIETDEYEVFGQTQTERISVVRWTGSAIPLGEFQDFGIAAVFTETQDELAFPVTKGCGLDEQAWTEVADDDEDRGDLDFPAPVVDVVPAPTTDLPALQAAVEELRGRLDEVQAQVEEAPGPALRGRVADLEDRLAELEALLEGAEEPEDG
jgi:uncharacterized protein YcnI